MRLPHGMSLTRSQIVLLATLLTVVSTSATSESSHRRVRTTSSENVNNDSSGADTSISGLHLNASRENQLRRLIRIRTPKVVISSNDEFEEGEGYVFGVEQEKASPRQMGGINIKDEARWLANKLRTLSNDEMGVTSMQVCIRCVFDESWNSYFLRIPTDSSGDINSYSLETNNAKSDCTLSRLCVLEQKILHEAVLVSPRHSWNYVLAGYHIHA